MAKISSDKIAANDAISKIVDVSHQSLTNQNVSLGFSNVSSMKKAVEISNQIIGDMSKLVDCTYKQADKIQALADIIEQRDNQDSLVW